MNLISEIEEYTGYSNENLDKYLKQIRNLKENYRRITRELEETHKVVKVEREKLLKFYVR